MTAPTPPGGRGRVQCPKCHSLNWSCWDERSRPCWDAEGRYVGDAVIGGLRCVDCGAVWLDYSVDPSEDGDCECEGWDD